MQKYKKILLFFKEGQVKKDVKPVCKSSVDKVTLDIVKAYLNLGKAYLNLTKA